MKRNTDSKFNGITYWSSLFLTTCLQDIIINKADYLLLNFRK